MRAQMAYAIGLAVLFSPLTSSADNPPAPNLRSQPGQAAPAELVQKILRVNQLWMRPPTQPLAYDFLMKLRSQQNSYQASVNINASGHVQVRTKNSGMFEGQVTDAYDPRNSAYPPRLSTLLQGVTWFGPLQEFAMAPQNIAIRLVGEERLAGVDAQVLQFQPNKKPTADHGPYLAMRVGCGIWGSWYGYSGGGADIAQVWVDKASGAVLREEGFMKGEPRFTVEHNSLQRLPDGRSVPRRVVVSLLGKNEGRARRAIYPWIFDMKFSLVDGRAWLLSELVESQAADKAMATAKLTPKPLAGSGKQ